MDQLDRGMMKFAAHAEWAAQLTLALRCWIQVDLEHVKVDGDTICLRVQESGFNAGKMWRFISFYIPVWSVEMPLM